MKKVDILVVDIVSQGGDLQYLRDAVRNIQEQAIKEGVKGHKIYVNMVMTDSSKIAQQEKIKAEIRDLKVGLPEGGGYAVEIVPMTSKSWPNLLEKGFRSIAEEMKIDPAESKLHSVQVVPSAHRLLDFHRSGPEAGVVSFMDSLVNNFSQYGVENSHIKLLTELNREGVIENFARGEKKFQRVKRERLGQDVRTAGELYSFPFGAGKELKFELGSPSMLCSEPDQPYEVRCTLPAPSRAKFEEFAAKREAIEIKERDPKILVFVGYIPKDSSQGNLASFSAAHHFYRALNSDRVQSKLASLGYNETSAVFYGQNPAIAKTGNKGCRGILHRVPAVSQMEFHEAVLNSAGYIGSGDHSFMEALYLNFPGTLSFCASHHKRSFVSIAHSALIRNKLTANAGKLTTYFKSADRVEHEGEIIEALEEIILFTAIYERFNQDRLDQLTEAEITSCEEYKIMSTAMVDAAQKALVKDCPEYKVVQAVDDVEQLEGGAQAAAWAPPKAKAAKGKIPARDDVEVRDGAAAKDDAAARVPPKSRGAKGKVPAKDDAAVRVPPKFKGRGGAVSSVSAELGGIGDIPGGRGSGRGRRGSMRGSRGRGGRAASALSVAKAAAEVVPDTVEGAASAKAPETLKETRVLTARGGGRSRGRGGMRGSRGRGGRAASALSVAKAAAEVVPDTVEGAASAKAPETPKETRVLTARGGGRSRGRGRGRGRAATAVGFVKKGQAEQDRGARKGGGQPKEKDPGHDDGPNKPS